MAGGRSWLEAVVMGLFYGMLLAAVLLGLKGNLTYREGVKPYTDCVKELKAFMPEMQAEIECSKMFIKNETFRRFVKYRDRAEYYFNTAAILVALAATLLAGWEHLNRSKCS